jgi:hypothetical protein
VRREALLLLACLCGCATAIHSAPAYSKASVAGKYRITSTVKPYVKFAGGPKIGDGEVFFDGRGNLSGQQVFLGESSTIHGTYEINPDGTGTADVIATMKDGSSSESPLTLQIQNDEQIKFVSAGLRQGSDWISTGELMATSQAGVSGLFEKESSSTSAAVDPKSERR